MKIAVRMKDGSKREFALDQQLPYDDVIALVRAEIQDAVCILVRVK